MDYQWYPGHMTKAKRMMQENVRLVDLVIEILDARVPLSGRNPDVDQLAQGKQRMVILSKADLADPKLTAQFTDYFAKKNIAAIALDARTKKANAQIMKTLQKITKEKKERDLKRGIRNRPVRAMICGIPNVGKSTFINSLSGRSSAKTGNKPGVTKGKQWISFAGLELLDTPGILWPKFEDQNVGLRLALVGSIKDDILDEEKLARSLLDILLRRYPEMLCARYFDGNAAASAMEETVEIPGLSIMTKNCRGFWFRSLGRGISSKEAEKRIRSARHTFFSMISEAEESGTSRWMMRRKHDGL